MYWPITPFVPAAIAGFAALLVIEGQGLAEPTESEAEFVAQPDDVDNQEIGGLMGIAIGGGTSPGGLHLEGRYLYRMSEVDWLESSVHFSFGGGDAECYLDRSGNRQCGHGLVDGILAQGNVGLRRYFAGQQQFRPFARMGVGVGLLSFADDSVTGLAIPLYMGAGVRAEVAENVLVVVDATFRAGLGFLNQELGIEGFATGTIAAGVEFTLD